MCSWITNDGFLLNFSSWCEGARRVVVKRFFLTLKWSVFHLARPLPALHPGGSGRRVWQMGEGGAELEGGWRRDAGVAPSD